MTLRSALTRAVTLALTLTAAVACAKPNPDDLAGRVVGEGPDGPVTLPLMQAHYDVDIQGTLATVRLTQVFMNPSAQPMRAEYLFPLNQKAAVFAMEMRVGDEVIRAQIQTKREAEETFEAAASEGKTASLLTQHRPNMFTQSVANLMPGEPVEVTLSYVQRVPKIDQAYELVIPMIVGPRYDGPQTADPLELATVELAPTGVWDVADLPAYPGVAGLDLPEKVAGDRVSLDLDLTSGVPFGGLDSATHPLDVTQTEEGLTATFADGKTRDNRDFILRYRLGGEETSVAALGHYDDRGGFVSLRIEPPSIDASDLATPRELVFVLDTSGSMGGAPMRASKVFMSAAIDALRPDDYFRIIRFSNSASQFSAQPLRASVLNKARAQAHVKMLFAGGGTNINQGITAAFDTAQPKDTMRIVVFLSDGYIGDEATVLKTIRQRIGAARIYAFGVGSSVNRYLLDEMAEEGRGYARYVDPTQEGDEVAVALARDLKTPLLTDIEVDWGGLEVTGQSPLRLPDLFDGKGVEVLARYTGDGAEMPAEITVRGKVQGRAAEIKITPSLPGAQTSTEGTDAIPLIWARTRIADLEADMLGRGADTAQLEAAVTKLGLTFALQSRFTSFVAVSERIVNPAGAPDQVSRVALPMPAGVPPTAYPKTKFSGSSAPEPEMILGLLLACALGGLRFMRARRAI